MDTTLMPWVVGLFVLIVASAVYLITRAKKNRNRPAHDRAATKSGSDASLRDK